MPSLCETCPILEKIDTCCSSNPETGATKILRLKSTGETIEVCDNLGTDGKCEIYDERPDQCREYVCERVYAQGLNSQGLDYQDSERQLPIYEE